MDATKRITKNLGGDRLGSGDKNNITMHAYNRSNHDLSRAWRSTMNVGTLIPCFKELALNGETWSIDLQALTRTIPTQVPLYGSFKQQIDFFVCPIRLYNGLLHNNMVKIGMEMDNVKLPKITLETVVQNPNLFIKHLENSQTSSTCLERYLGLNGFGDIKTSNIKDNTIPVSRKFQCVPELAYYDIYKNYYANKQEDKGVIIANGNLNTFETMEQLTVVDVIGGYTSETIINQPSTPPVLFTINYDTYQQLAQTEEMLALRTYSIQGVSDRFDKIHTEVIIEKIDTSGTPTVTTWEKADIGTVFNNVHFMYDNQLWLGQPNAAYCSDPANSIERRLYAFSYNKVLEQTDGIGLVTFDLKNIDDMRIAILRDTGVGNEFSMNTQNYYPYRALYSVAADGKTNNLNMQQGIAVKTYQSDLLNNWLQTEWIDGTNGINQITAIDVTSGSFTIDAFNLASKVYNMLNRIAVSGGSYEDWQEAVYSTEAVRRAEQPIYVGGMSSEIVFDEVVSTAATEEQPLGTLAGRGLVANQRGGKIEIRIDEPSYIIGIVSITPRLDYSQGNDWDRTELETVNDFHKPALDGIGFEDLLQERGAWWGTYYDDQDQEWVKLALGKTPAWINYMTAINKSYGEFAEENKRMIMTLNRRYEYQEDQTAGTPEMGITDATTYIDPTKYNYSFADKSLEAQNFWVQIGIKCEVRRVMSAKAIPYL